MKALFFIVLTLFFVQFSIAQSTLTNNGSEIVISNGSVLTINGDLIISHVNGMIVPLEGTVEISGDIINSTSNTVFVPDLGGTDLFDRKVIFSGNQDQYINSSNITFYQIEVNKTGGELVLGNDITVFHKLALLNGNIFLNNYDIYIRYKPADNYFGILNTESGIARIYDNLNNSGKIWTKRNGAIFSGVISEANFGINVIGSDAKVPQDYTIERFHDKIGKDPLAGPGNGSIQRSYKITKASASPEPIDSIVFSYFDNENTSGLDENDFGPWVSYDNTTTWFNKWNDVTDSRDTTANSINSFRNDSIYQTQQLTIAESNCIYLPPINFLSDTVYLCTGTSTILNPEVTGLSYNWSTGATTDTIHVNTPGTFKLIVRNSAGCEKLDSVIVIEKKLPLPAIGFDNNLNFVCNNTAFTFVNNTTTDPGTELSTVTYEWKFGDANNPTATSTLQNPSYQYINFGSHSVSLEATTEFGCVGKATKPVTVLEIPKADFAVASACTNSTILVTDNTSYTTANLTYKWVFSDVPNDTITSSIPLAKEISTEGNYDLTLVVRPNSNACADTLTRSFQVTPRPIISIAAIDTVCVGVSIGLTNNTTISSGSVLYNWDFSDGASSALKTPVKNFSNGGDFTAILHASSGTGCSESDTLRIHVIEIPSLSFSATNVCVGDTAQFDVLAPLGVGYTYEWTIPGHPIQYGTSVRTKMNVAGTQTIQLNVLESHGCTNSLSKQMEVYPKPISNFSFVSACVNNNINLNNLSSIASGGISYLWNFGDGTLSTQQNPSKSFASAGNFDITLTTQSANGCSDVITKSISISDTPMLDLGGIISTCGSSYMIDALNAGATYVWSDNSINQTLTASSNGNYWVKVTSPAGCSIIDTVLVTLHSEVMPNLGPNTSVCGNIELDAGYPGGSYLWSDGSTSRYLQVSTSGTYSVNVTDANGCQGNDSVDILISTAASVDLGTDMAVCTNGTVTLDAGAGYTYIWTDGSTSQTLDVGATGIYDVTVTNPQGCSASDEIYVELNQLPIIGLEDSYIACDEITLDAGEGFSNYLWSTGSTSRLVTFTSSQNISLEVTNSLGCSSQKAISISINTIPFVDLGLDIVACDGQFITLDAGIDNVSYLWSTGETTKIITVGAKGAYRVLITTLEGCTNEDEINVNYEAPLITNWESDQLMCQQEGITLDAGTTGFVYSWYYDNQLLVENSNDPTLFATDAGAYRLEVSAGSCSEIATVNVTETTNNVKADFLVSSIADVGDTVQFVQLSTPAPSWFEWRFGDGTISHAYHPDYVYFTPGEYEITLTVSNGVCNDVLTKTITVNQLKEDKGVIPIEEVSFTEVLHVKTYPNPTTTGRFMFKVELNKEASIDVAILDLRGRVISTNHYLTDNLEEQFDISEQQSGMYIIKAVVDRDIILVKRIVKK